MASSPNGEAWTVGLAPAGAIVERVCAIRILDAGFAPLAATVAHGSAATWLAPDTDVQGHAVADATGMELFDSGIRAPGESFSYRFIAAGRYAVLDAVDAASATIRVPMRVAPSTGGTQTSFLVEWAAEAAPAAFAYDVQIRRPGAGSFSAWRTGATTPARASSPTAAAARTRFARDCASATAARIRRGPPPRRSTFPSAPQ